jgi:hypothetical protein
MSQYYYLISSLQFLRFREKPPVNHASFLEDCRSWLDDENMRQVRLAVLDIENIPAETALNETLLKWVIFENSLRTEMVRVRAAGLGISPEPYFRKGIESDPSAFSKVREALKDPSLYKAQMAVWELRWNFLEDLGAGHFFDITAVIVYGLKLQILERVGLYSAEKGQQVFHSIYEGSRDDGKKHRNNHSR